ncbi:MAG TPA: helix-turn-helix domain-containing protein [Pyrinomonadaceae bacterium]|nr:helix-turn-helix domain-containing protein [Pyrinomonadaceae bacterium]
MRARLEVLIEEMLEGQILLSEALNEFEKLYIRKALSRNKHNLSKTASALGVHRNTIAKRVAAYQRQDRPLARAKSNSR